MSSRFKKLIDELVFSNEELQYDSSEFLISSSNPKRPKSDVLALLKYYRLSRAERISNSDLVYFQKILDERSEEKVKSHRSTFLF